MKKILLSLIVFLLPLLSFSQLANVSAASSVSQLPTNSKVYLKAGPYYILYTHPIAPYLDSNNRLLIPLRAYEDLFGGTVSYQSTTKTAQVKWLDHTFEFVADSEKAEVDGNLVTMDTKPVVKDGAILLPMRLFLNSTNLKYHWDNQQQLLVLEDEKVLVGEPFEDFKGNDLYPHNADAQYQILNYSIKSTKTGYFELKINAKNISDKDTPAGKADIHPLVTYANRGGFSTDSYSRPSFPHLPEIKSGKEVSVVQTFPKNVNEAEYVEYIITVARIFS